MHPAAPNRKASPPSSVPPLALAAVVAANVFLAFGPVFVRQADVGPVAAAFWRMALALPLIALAAWATRPRGAPMPHLSGGAWLLIAAAGVAFAGDLGAWHIGILHTTMANATLFGNCATFIFPLYGFLMARAWPTRTQGVALLLALAGTVLLMGRSYQLDPRHLVGDLLSVVAGVLYAIYFVMMSTIRRTLSPLPALGLSSAASLLPLLALALVLNETVMPGNWTPLVTLALMAQVAGQGCMIYALGKLSPLVVGLALLIQPVVAMAVGWIVFAERLGAPDLVGILMVAAALVLVRRDPDPGREVIGAATPAANLAPEETR